LRLRRARRACRRRTSVPSNRLKSGRTGYWSVIPSLPGSSHSVTCAILATPSAESRRESYRTRRPAPQSTQNASPSFLLCACSASVQCFAGTRGFTTSPHIGQARTGASRRPWLKFGQRSPLMCLVGIAQLWAPELRLIP
jgi:hypothetical protein